MSDRKKLEASNGIFSNMPQYHHTLVISVSARNSLRQPRPELPGHPSNLRKICLPIKIYEPKVESVSWSSKFVFDRII
jgi:hypothetical protein